jgi:U3 small nucleolar RNA-associated protein 3
MGKRKTAKTGDKALYGSREELANQARNKRRSDKDDPMYDEVDRFHNDKDESFIRLTEEDRQNSDDEDEDLAGNTHNVLDLGAGGTSSEEDDDGGDDESSSDEEEDNRHSNRKVETHSSSEDEVSSDDDDDDDDLEMAKQDPRNWGKKKSLYYHGDTADLEIGQEEDDAFLEEEAAKEIQKSRFEEMDEDDFVLSDDEASSKKKNSEASEKSKSKHEELQTIRDASKLSKKETRKLLEKQYPELLPMVSYFADVVTDLKDRTQIATTVLMEGEDTAESVGATIKGQQYLLTKAMIQKSIALNSVMYILLRYASVGDEDATSNIQAHPVMDQLKKFTGLLEKLEEGIKKKTKDIDLQLDNLVKAAALMSNAGEADDDDDGQSASEDEDEPVSAMAVGNENIASDDEKDFNDDDVSDDSDDMAKIAQKKQEDYERTLNEARFGLRPNEAKKSSLISRKRRTDHMDDFGDLEEEGGQSSGNVLASTMNTIEQRSQTASRKRRPAPVAEQLDDLDEYDDRVAEGIKMMEEEMGKLDGGSDDDDDDDDNEMDVGENKMSDPDGDDDVLGFYNQIAAKSKDKKSFKKSLYKVAPKFPRVDGEVAGERALSKAILKNRGLVAHKPKINRNPRVKKREQYRKALIRRKGAVREVRNAEEGNQYGGEQTGIKSRISRSRKLV